MRYAFNRLEGVVLSHIHPYVDRVNGDVKLVNLQTLTGMLQLAFGDQDIQATMERELLKLQQKNRGFTVYSAEL
jgi:hypothetical protein